MIYSIYFSPTGGTKKVADILTSVWPAYETIDISAKEDYSKYQFTKDDTAIISVPSYGGRVPEIAIERLSQIRGNGARAVLNVVYGNREYDDTLLELKDAAIRQGFVPMAAITAIAEHSVVREIAAGRPDSEDQKELLSIAGRVREFLSQNQTLSGTDLSVSGNPVYKEYGKIPLKPKAGKKCSACGICAGLCPTGAIPKESPDQTDTELCISCMRCISVCPQNARKLNKLLLAGASASLKPKCAQRKNNTCMLAQ